MKSLGDDIRANGIMLSRDEKIVYVTNGNVILAFDIQPDGSVTNRRDFATLEAGGNGDGMAIDDDGRLYVTSAPGVQVLQPGRQVSRADPHSSQARSASRSSGREQDVRSTSSAAARSDRMDRSSRRQTA